MKTIPLLAVTVGFVFGIVTPLVAHGDKPHPKCKKGCELNDQDRCVKKK